jgi:hypothetical protein
MRHEFFTAALWAACFATRMVLRRGSGQVTAEPPAPVAATPAPIEPAPPRARLDERTLLNLPGFHGSASVYTYVEDTSECELRHGWNFEPLVMLEITDCSRLIRLEFDIDSAEGRRNSLHKLDTLQTAVRLFREALVAEFEPYDQRERELLQRLVHR